MGYTGIKTNGIAGDDTMMQAISEELPGEVLCTILKGHPDKHAYSAVKKDNGSVVAYVTAIIAKKNELLIKVMHECEVPLYFGCPAKILLMLTPTFDNNSKDWRKKCYQCNNLKPVNL